MADDTDKAAGLLGLAKRLAKQAVSRAIERLTGQPLSALSAKLRPLLGELAAPPPLSTTPPAKATSRPVTLPSSPSPQVTPPGREAKPHRAKPPTAVVAPVAPEPSTTPPPEPPHEPLGLLDLEEVPESYGLDEVGLLVRDPHWLVAYWEVTPAAWERARAELRGDGALTLRIFVQSPETQGRLAIAQDERLPWNHGRRGLRPPRPGAVVSAAVGLLASDGRFATMAQAPRVVIPPTETSPGPATWMAVDPLGPVGPGAGRPPVRATGDAAHVAAVIGEPPSPRRQAWLERERERERTLGLITPPGADFAPDDLSSSRPAQPAAPQVIAPTPVGSPTGGARGNT